MKLVVVAFVVAVVLVGAVVHRRWQRGLHRDVDHPRLPVHLAGGWVVFTTPYCAACEPVKERLREIDPDTPVRTVDATREPRLAEACQVRSAPTVLLTDSEGNVRRRLVGATAVGDYADRVASAKAG